LEVLQAARKASCEIVEQGTIGDETLRTVGQELMPKDAYGEMATAHLRQFFEILDGWLRATTPILKEVWRLAYTNLIAAGLTF